MTAYNNLMDQLQDNGALFNVRTEDVITGSGIAIPNKKAIINESTGGIIGVVGDKYKVVTNEEVFNAFLNTVVESGIDTDGATLDISFANNGGKTLVDFRFPNHEIDIDGDKSQLRISTLNSYDGSTRLKARAGALRLACLNGQLIGGQAGYSSTHRASLDINEGARQIMAMLQNFENAKGMWTKMMARKVTLDEVMMVFADFSDGNNDDLELFGKRPQTQHLLNLWTTYSTEMGNTVWALYNVLTDFISHKAYKAETKATGRLYNEGKLERIIESNPLFLEVA